MASTARNCTPGSLLTVIVAAVAAARAEQGGDGRTTRVRGRPGTLQRLRDDAERPGAL
jgi:hypothetical protein